jgi:hypothetical protein
MYAMINPYPANVAKMVAPASASKWRMGFKGLIGLSYFLDSNRLSFFHIYTLLNRFVVNKI